jgi:hypothetical protein
MGQEWGKKDKGQRREDGLRSIGAYALSEL